MDSLFNFFVKQKKLALVFTVSVIAIGFFSLLDIQRDQFPVVDFEVVTITTTYSGASPEDVEQKITNPIEDELRNITGIDNFVSVSREGISRIQVTLLQDISDTSDLKQEIKNAVDRVRDLPKEVDLPKVADIKNSLRSILRVNISSETLDFSILRDNVDVIARELELLDGVSEVVKEGYLDREIQIRIDIDKLDQYELSLPQVLDVIERRNKRYTAGDNNDNMNEKNIVVLANFNEAKAVGDVIIKSSFDGPIVRLKDIASIIDGNAKETSIVRINGGKGFVLKIRKQEKKDIIDTIDLVKAKVKDLQNKKYPELKFFYSSDLSKFVRNRLDIVAKNGVIGLLLVLLVLGVFLSLKTAFWVALSLPVSLLGAVALLGMSGETINLVSMAAMILVLGIVVDDSIIVAESIHRYKQLGEDKYRSVIRGFKRVIMPVITTILTTILAFSSMFLMDGIMGKFIYMIPMVVIFALTLSFLEITIALPAHLANVDEKRKPLGKVFFDKVENWFEGFLNKVLKKRYIVVLGFLLLLFASIIFAFSQMRVTLFPAVGADVIFADLHMPAGSSLKNTAKASEKIEIMITDIVGEDLDSLTNTIGKRFNYRATLQIDLVPSGQRKQQAQALLTQLEQRMKDVPDIEKLTFSVRRPGPPQGEDVEIQIVSSNDKQRKRAANALEKILSNIKGLNNIDRDDKLGKSRIEVLLDFEKMARLDVDFSTVSRYLKSAFTGINVTDIRYGEKDVDFRVYLGKLEQSESIINGLKIINRKGRPVPIKQFSSIQYIDGEPDFNHFNGQRSVLISGSVDDQVTTSQAVIKQALKQLNAIVLYPDVRILSEGGGKETQKSMKSLLKAFLIAVFAIFLLLVLLFNSYTQPLLILSAIPFSAIGVIWAFFLHAQALSFFAMLGGLALVGVIVNDSLVMVSHLNYLKQKLSDTTSVFEWIIRGSKERLRAVVLTTLTTLAGVIPLAYGIGGSDFILQPMALSLGYGLLFGTLMTLVLLPCLYLMNYEFVNWIQSKINR